MSGDLMRFGQWDSPGVLWTLLDTGLRVSEFAHLKKDNVQWQERRLILYGKSGPYGKKTKGRILPMTDRVRRLIEYHFAEHNNMGMSTRTIQRIVKQMANRAGIAKPVTPHVLPKAYLLGKLHRERGLHTGPDGPPRP